jgi:hypothetical protein
MNNITYLYQSKINNALSDKNYQNKSVPLSQTIDYTYHSYSYYLSRRNIIYDDLFPYRLNVLELQCEEPISTVTTEPTTETTPTPEITETTPTPTTPPEPTPTVWELLNCDDSTSWSVIDNDSVLSVGNTYYINTESNDGCYQVISANGVSESIGTITISINQQDCVTCLSNFMNI